MPQLTPIESPKDAFFWSAPNTETEFSGEDPLAIGYLAQQIGLFLLPTLTTRSSRAQAFAVVLYGLHLAEQQATAEGRAHDDDRRRRLFERWERFWALSVLELRRGDLDRGDPDAMRGVRGAKRNWRDGEQPLPLDFQLISRQSELGNLGAYLSPLRLAGLVKRGSLSISVAATEIVAAFWTEPVAHARTQRYDAYALEALDEGRARIARKYGGITLAKIGGLSCLTSIWSSRRAQQQQRLHRALILDARDTTTKSVATIVETAASAGLIAPREILVEAIDGRLGEVDVDLANLFRTALAFGDLAQCLLDTFDRIYAALVSAGFIARRSRIAERTLDEAQLKALHQHSEALLDAPCASRIQTLPVHGAPLMRVLREIRKANADEVVMHLLAYHRGVQRDRRWGDAWIRDHGGELTLLLTNYKTQDGAARFPSFKLDVLRSLLRDLGRIAPAEPDAEDEEDA